MNQISLMVLTAAQTATQAGVDVSGVTSPIIALVKSFAAPIIGVVSAVGMIYCIILGVKLAKAEEPQDREKAKGALKNAIIGFILIFVLIVALVQFVPILTEWMGQNAGIKNTTTGF